MTRQVREFHAAFELPAPGTHPLRPEVDLLQLRLRLIDEEYKEVRAEFERALAAARAKGTPDDFLPIYRDMLKELVDLQYVVQGAAVSLGLPFDPGYDEVHRSNMSKLDDDGRPLFREDGKVLKSHNYKEADMTYIIPDYIEASV